MFFALFSPVGEMVVIPEQGLYIVFIVTLLKYVLKGH